MTRSDLILGTIRTGVPGAVGAFLAWLVAQIPAVADYIAMTEAQLATLGFAGTSVEGLLSAAIIGLIIAAYYWAVRKIGAKYPSVEKWLLGSAKQPVYFTPADAHIVTDSIPVPESREAVQTAGDSVIVAENQEVLR